MRQRVAAGQAQHTGRCVIARSDAGAGGHRRQRIAGKECAAADRHRSRDEVGAFGVADRGARRQCRRGRTRAIRGRRRHIAEHRRKRESLHQVAGGRVPVARRERRPVRSNCSICNCSSTNVGIIELPCMD